MKVKHFGVFLLLFICYAYSLNNESKPFYNLVLDFLKIQNSSLNVKAFLKDKNDCFKMFLMLSKINYQAEVHFKNIPNLNYESDKLIYVVDLDYQFSRNLISMADKSDKFNLPYRWLFIDNSMSINNTIIRYLEGQNVLMNSDVTIARLNENNNFDLKKIYKRRKWHNIIEEKMGSWSETGFELLNFEFIVSKRRKDFQRLVLNSSIVLTHPDTRKHLKDKRDRHIDSIAKVNYVLVEHLADIVNAELQYTIQNTWGYKDNNSQWSGMIGELTRNEADIGGTALFFTIDRVSSIQYLSMTTPTRSKFIFREPKLSYVTNVYTLPFDTKVWTSIIFLCILSGIVLFIVVKWEWQIKMSYKNEPSSTSELNNMGDVATLTFGALCQQGSAAIPSSYPGRIATVFLFISLMFLYTSYSANIVALLQSSSKNIQTLEDLLKSRLEVGVDDTVFNHFFFPNATEPIRRAIYLQKVAPNGQNPKFYEITEGVKRMRKGLFAFHMETGPGYKIVSETFEEGEKCGIQEIQFIQVIDPYLAIQKNSSFKEPLKIGLLRIREVGIQSREVSLIYTKKPSCLALGSNFISVGIVDCYPAAVALGAGVIIAFLIYLVELLMYLRNSCAAYLSKRKIQNT